MAYYENVFIARQDISATQVDSLTEAFTNTVENGGGKVTKQEYWGLRNLAYKIKKNRKGHYVLLNLDASADVVQELERQMRINEDILRYLTIRLDELSDEPSPIMQNRGREDRPRRERPRDDSRDAAPTATDDGADGDDNDDDKENEE